MQQQQRNQGQKKKKIRIFGFFCLCHTVAHQEFPSAAGHAQPCPDLTPAPSALQGSFPGDELGAWGAPNPPRMLRLLWCGCREVGRAPQTPGAGLGGTTSSGRQGGTAGGWQPTLARGQGWPCGVMCSWILFKSVRREDSSEHWINSTFSLSLSLFLLGK